MAPLTTSHMSTTDHSTTSHMSTIGHHSTTVESEKYLHFDMEYLQWTILDLGLSEGPHRLSVKKNRLKKAKNVAGTELE
ncbi:hypothetical protein LguiB_014200 [Lonicera macranthoides]